MITLLFTMFDVGFGDCFLLSNKDEILLVDCGTVSIKDDVFFNLVDSINAQHLSSAKRKEGLITHFHDDHIKGFRYLSDKKIHFDKIYVPYLHIEDANNHRPIILELAVFLYTFLPSYTNTFLMSKSILNHINIITKLSTNIKYLSSFDNFNFGNKTFQVIWPDKEINFDKRFTKYLDYLDSITLELSEFLELKQRILDNMINGYEYATDSNLEHNYDQLLYVAETQLSLLEHIRKVGQEYRLNDEISNNLKYYGTRLFRMCTNSTSVVFHDKFCSPVAEEIAVSSEIKIDNKSILMMGDVTKDVIRSYLGNRFLGPYHILKSPHHGTRSHYSRSLPLMDKLCISTGYKPPFGKVACEYRLHGNIKSDRICTSGANNCEMLSRGFSCYNPSCSNKEFTETI